MNTRHRSADHHEGREQDDDYAYRSCYGLSFTSSAHLKHKRRHHTQDQKRRGRGVRRLQRSTYQDRPVVDRDHLEDQVGENHQNIIQPQKKDVRIDPDEALPPDKLKDADDSKAQADGNGDKSQPIRDRVNAHMYARKMMKPKVERRKADLCSVWPRRLHVNTSDQRRPQQECQQEPKDSS